MAIVAGLGLIAGGAAAQDKLYSDAELSYTLRDAGGTEIGQTLFAVSAGYDYGTFDVIADLASTRYVAQADGPNPELGLSAVGLDLGYRVAPEVKLHGAFVALEIDGDQTHFAEAGVTYQTGRVWLTGFVGQGDDGLVLADSYAGAVAGMEFGQGTEAALGLYGSGDDTAGDVLTLAVLHRGGPLEWTADYVASDEQRLLATSAIYAASPRIDLRADVERFTGADEDTTGLALGAGYEVAPALVAFGQVSRLSGGDGPDVTGATIGVTYRTGARSLREDGSFRRLIRPLFFGGDRLPDF